MKKLFAMLLALVMCLSIFASCGNSVDEKEKDEEVDEKVDEKDKDEGKNSDKTSLSGNASSNVILKKDTTDSIRISLMLDDTSVLEEYDIMAKPTVQNAKVDCYIDYKDPAFIAQGAGLIDGEELEVLFAAEEDKIVFDFVSLDETYGFDIDELKAEYPAFHYYTKIFAEGFPAAYNIMNAKDSYAAKYTPVFIEAIKTYLDVEENFTGDTRSLEFELEPLGVVLALGEFADVIEEDPDIDDFTDALGISADVFSALSSPSVLAVLPLATSVSRSGSSDELPEIKLTFHNDEMLIGVELEWSNSHIDEWNDGYGYSSEEGIKLFYEFDPDTDELVFSIETAENNITTNNYLQEEKFEDNAAFELTYDGDGNFDISSSTYYYEYDIQDGDPYEYENKDVYNLSGEITDDEVILTVNENGEETVVELNYEYDDSGFLRLELATIEVDGMSVDLEDLGLAIEFEKNPTLPKISSKYEELGVESEDLKAIENAFEMIGETYFK